MSHIPSSAMPHAKTHEQGDEKTVAAPIKAAKGVPWLAVVVGGALAVGTAVTAAIALRPAKPVRRRVAARKPRARKPKDA